MVQVFRVIDEQANQMRALISDLLDATRIETGTLSVTPRAGGSGCPGGSGPEDVPQQQARRRGGPRASPPSGDRRSRGSTRLG